MLNERVEMGLDEDAWIKKWDKKRDRDRERGKKKKRGGTKNENGLFDCSFKKFL